MQVFTGGLDGYLRLWDLDSGKQIDEYAVGLPIFSMVKLFSFRKMHLNHTEINDMQIQMLEEEASRRRTPIWPCLKARLGFIALLQWLRCWRVEITRKYFKWNQSL